MTAIYSYASPDSEIGFIASDNRELPSFNKVDKVTLVGQRYAIGCHGKNLLFQVLEYITSFEGFTNIDSPKKLKEILTETWELTKLISAVLYKEKTAERSLDKISDFEWMEFTSLSSATLIILDCETYTLYEVEQKQLFPPEKINFSAETRQMENNLLHLSSFASIAARRDTENASFSDINNVLTFLTTRLQRDKEREPKIGDLGAAVVVHNGIISRYSAFEGPKDYVSGMLGEP